MTPVRSVAALLIVGFLCAADLHAQSNAGALVSGTVGAAVVDSHTDISVTAAAGYRFNRAFGLGVELTWMPSLQGELPDYYPLGLVRIDDADGSITAFTTNVRLEIPTTPARIVPYVVMGGGVANVKESANVIIQGLPSEVIPQIFPSPIQDIRAPFSVSTTDLALTVGGGVSILATHGMSVDVDLRYLRLMGDADRNIGRFGAGVSYRF